MTDGAHRIELSPAEHTAGVRARWLLLAAGITALLAYLLFATDPTSPAGTNWTTGDALQVERVSIDDTGTPKEILLSWPAPSGAVDRFELKREGTVVATVGGTTLSAVDPSPPDTTTAQTYTVSAILGGSTDDTLGSPDVRIPDPTTGCTILWTGGADSNWDDTANWAPYGESGTEGPVRTPTTSDHVCVDHPLNTPITITTSGNTAGQFTGTWYRPETLRVERGDLRITGSAVIPAIQMAGGTLDLQNDTKLLWASGRPELRLGGGELIIGTQVEIINDANGQILGDIVADSGTTTTIDGGSLTALRMRLDTGTNKTLIGENGHTTRILTDLDLNGDNTLTAGAGGATLVTRGIEIDSGATTIGWAVAGDPSNGLYINSDAGRLVLNDLSDLGPADTTLENTDIDLRAEVVLAEGLSVLGGELDVQQAGASLTSGGSATAFAGLRQAESLTVRNSSVVIDGDLAVDELSLINGAELVIQGALKDAAPDWDSVRVDKSRLSVGQPSTLKPSSFLEVGEQARIAGDITAEGTVYAAETIDAVGYSDGIFEDDLTLTDTSTLQVGADGTGADDATALEVRGQLTVDGELDIEVINVLPDGTDLVIVETQQPPLGTFDTITVRGAGSADAGGDVRDDGIHLTSGSPPPDPECADNLPNVRDMPVKGCWAERVPGRVWFSDYRLISGPTDIPSIGGIRFDPQSDHEIVLDLTDPSRGRLVTADPRGNPGLAEVRMLLDTTGGGLTENVGGITEVIDFGDLAVDWSLDGSANVLAIPDFLGMPVDAASVTLNQTWEIGADVVLPGVLGAQEVAVRAIDTGRGITENVQAGVETAIAGVVDLADADLVYQGAKTWQLANDAAERAIDAELTYLDGVLQAGEIAVERVGVGGFAVADTVLTWNRTAATWASDALAPDGLPATRIVETAAGAIDTGSRVAIGVTELGIATVREGTELVKTATEWQLDGTVAIAGGVRNITSTGLRFVDGVLVEGAIELAGSYGQLAEFVEVELVLPATSVPGETIDRAAVLYDTTTRIVGNGIDITRTGSLALLEGTVEHAQLPIEFAIGELADVVGVLRYDPLTGRFPLTGADPAQRALLTCGGGGSPVGSDAGLSGGVPTSGALLLTELCFGPVTLDDVSLAYDETRDSYDITADAGGQPVTGDVTLEDGQVRRGNISLPDIDLAGWLTVPAVELTHSVTPAGDTFTPSVDPRAGDLLRGFRLGFTDGRLVLGELALGDLPGPDLTELVADATGLLPVGGIDFDYDEARQTWLVAGFLDEPSTAISGQVGIADGGFDSGELDFRDVRLGSLAQFDLALKVEGPRSFSLDGTLEGPAFEGAREVSGAFDFAGGALQAGQIVIPEFPVGELVELQDLAFVAGPNGWSIGGQAVYESGNTGLSGSGRFVDGELVALDLTIDDLRLGASTVDELTFTLDRGTGADAYAVSGIVRGPAAGDASDPTAEQTEFSGSATIADGELIGFGATIPHLEIAGLAYLENINLSYLDDGRTVTLFGTGQATTADDTTPTVATMVAALDGGQVQTATVTAANLSLGGLITIDDFLMSYDRTGGATCEGDLGRSAVYEFGGTTGAGSVITGCAAIAGRTLVGAELAAARLSVGELFRIENLDARFVRQETYTVDLLDTRGARVPGGVELSRTALDLDADVRVGSGAPVSIDGALEFTDGGLSALSFTVPSLPLSATVELTDLQVEYLQPARFDGVSDTSFSLSGNAVHAEGTTSASGSLTFSAAGALTAAELSIADLPLGPFQIERFDFLFNGGSSTSWAISGEVTPPGGATAAVSGQATIDNGRLEAAAFTVDTVSIGELVLLDRVQFQFERLPNASERWYATANVRGLEQATDPAVATFEIVIAADGSPESGLIQVSHVRWGGLFTVDNLVVAGRRVGPDFIWTVNGQVRIGSGGTTALSGELVLREGVVQSGSLSMSNIRIDEIATIDRLDLAATRSGGTTTWAVSGQVTPGAGVPVAAAGEMTWQLGVLQSGRLELGDVGIAELFTLDSLEIEFVFGQRWNINGQVTHDEGPTALGGSMVFTDGALTGGQLLLAEVPLGPLHIRGLSLAVDATGAGTGSICGVADPGGPGTAYRVNANVRSADGDTTSLAGRLRLTPGVFTEGVLCGDGIQVADMILLDDVLIAYSRSGSGSDRTVNFDGSATVANPDDPADTASASVGFGIREGELQRFDLSAGGLNLGELLSLTDVELHFDRGSGESSWELAAGLERPGPDDTQITGLLEVDDGVIIGGRLTIADLPVGDLFTLTDLEITYRGRRDTTDPGALSNFTNAAGNSSCTATPSGPNVPGPGPSTGGESYFLISAEVEANDDSFAVRGSMSFADGRLTMFDVTLACLPLGDFKTLEGVRVAYREDLFVAAARLQDEEGTSGAGGELYFADGRLTGGQLRINDLPLGIVSIDELEIALGENPNGDTTFGLSLTVEDDGDVYGGGGSLTMRDGSMVAGSLEISEMPFLDLFTIEDFAISFDATVPDRASFAGGARVRLGSGATAGLDISMTFEDGRLIQGSFNAQQIDLFEVIPLGGFSITFDSINRSWSGSMDVTLPGAGGAGPGLQLGVEFQRGKLVSGLFGFDGDGDGEVDGLNSGNNPPASGGGDFAGLPLKALYIQYCAPNSTATFCSPSDAGAWSGRIAFELPTDSAPGLDASIRIRNGRFEYASVEIDSLGIPIYPGVFLERIAALIELNPRLRFAGGIGVSVGVGAFDVVDIDADFQFSEEPAPDPGQSPDAYEPEYLRFYTIGRATFLELPIRARSYVDIRTFGFVGVGAELDITIIGKVGPINKTLAVTGSADGWVIFDAADMNLTNPRTGNPLNGPTAQVSGEVAAIILGSEVASAEFVANPIGAMGCVGIDLGFLGEARVGAGIYWSDGQTRSKCDLDEFEIAGVETGEPIFERLNGRFTETVTQFSTFDVPAGEKLLGVEVEGIGGEPDVELVAPDGTVYDLDDDDIDAAIIVHDGDGKRWFIIGAPPAGEWTVVARPGSVPLGDVIVSLALPDVDVTGTVAPAGEGFVLDYSLLEIDGQEVAFVERSADPDDDYIAAVGGAIGAAGQIEFVPGGPLSGGERELVALVYQDGFLRAEVVLDTFVVPDAGFAPPPAALDVEEVVSGARVTWEPPTSTGGREITSYRVSSTAGWSVTTDGDGRSVFLPIPAMTVGEEVPVFVQACTGVGCGDTAVVYFTSSQTTGFQYAQGEIPETVLTKPLPSGEPTPTTTTTTTTTVPATTPTTVPISPELPPTGGSSTLVSTLALFAIGLGVTCLVVSRGGRRRGRSA